jgi:homoserine kinase
MKVSVKVPASTANLGPGFDCLGMALPLYNTITIEETVLPGTGIEINVMTEDEAIDEMTFENIPKDENNLIYKAVEMLYNSIGQEPSELKINIQTGIPITRGLGSSSSIVVGGLLAANKLLGNPADETALLAIATEVEGHPDNVAPAMFGGFCLASMEDDGSVSCTKLPWPENWKLTVLIPDYELDTAIARSVLPEKISIKDASFNVKKCAMLIDSVYRKDSEMMKKSLKDKIHQPYRADLIKGFKEISELIENKDDILGCVVSGAGPTILVISENNGFDKIKGDVVKIFKDLNVYCDIKTLNIENEGTKVI